MKVVCKVLCVVVTVCLSLSVFAADWPLFRGPNADGISPDTGINKSWKEKPPKQLWKYDLSDDGFAGPSAAGGKVFIIDHIERDDVVRALDLNTGEQAWEFKYPEAGKSDWGFARSTPVISDGKVYTLSRSGTLHCLNAADGTKVWSLNIITDLNGQAPKWKVSMSPVIDGNKLIVTPGGKKSMVVALNKNTGKVIWKGSGKDKISYVTPVVATIGTKKQYITLTNVSMISVDAANGKLLWAFPWKTKYGVNGAMPIVNKDLVFVSSGYDHGCALVKVGPGKAVAVWENTVMQAHFSSPILYKGYIYGTGDPSSLMCLDPKTGKSVWKKNGFEKGGILIVDGAIIALNGKGGDLVIAEATPKAYNELGRIKPLSGRCWTAPIIADGKVVVRNKKTLVCLDLK